MASYFGDQSLWVFFINFLNTISDEAECASPKTNTVWVQGTAG